ncbi:MAG: sigma-54-dependent Fis family transcriptional regulator [Deltaproteobacteria bacterium]|nr:MAG: sigma-54-dependent Fis family transcriptional regulator [Deltaproteobacteria bacterium]RLC19164.1 MAG: sigma-54-dependent Fis family transcriptional regulator [Deltaproteobacteria bacterium]
MTVHKEKILIIDDEAEMLDNCSRILKRSGYDCSLLQESENLTRVLKEDLPDLILTDLRMPKKDGMSVLKEAKAIDPDILVLMFTAYGTIESALEACKLGAFDYIQKPFSAEQLRIAVNRGIKQKRLSDENKYLRSQLKKAYGFSKIIGKSTSLQEVLMLVRKVSNTDANILIRGDSGTGKELIARSIHTNSERRNRPFVPVDCASLPENLLESELFGHEKGAFTGAHVTRPGIFEYANGGTLFLDEIGELNITLQSKLLRVLQERQVRRVGGKRLLNVDVRFIAATNQNLENAIQENRFREDLFYRVNVITIPLPSLKKRKDDIPLLANHFLKHFSKGSMNKVNGISKKAMEFMERYHWPGNVRELQNVIERAVSLTDSKMIVPEDLPEQLRLIKDPDAFVYSIGSTYKKVKKDWVDLFEKKYLSALLNRHNGNISKAALEAQINRKTIHRLLKRHRLTKDQPG